MADVEKLIAAVRLGIEGNHIGISLNEEVDAVASFAEIVVLWRAAEARVEAAEQALLVIPPDKLDLLADWFDADDEKKGGDRGGEVQADLRRMARLARAALACPPPEEER